MAKTTRSSIGEDRIKVWIQCEVALHLKMQANHNNGREKIT